MNDLLSIIVPVRDAEATLGAQAGQLLDLLPDLSSRFEILIVDDGSTDHTVELAQDLAREYPQVRLVRHVEPRGIDAAVQTGLQWSRGKSVLVAEGAGPLSAADLRRLWLRRHEAATPLPASTRPVGPFAPRLLDRLTAWGEGVGKSNVEMGSLDQPGSSLRIIRREVAEVIAGSGSADSPPRNVSPAYAPRDRSDEAHTTIRRETSRRETRRSAATFLDHLRDLTREA